MTSMIMDYMVGIEVRKIQNRTMVRNKKHNNGTTYRFGIIYYFILIFFLNSHFSYILINFNII
jgi:hypothetical protein